MKLALESQNRTLDVDVLQVDAEGFDDEVLRHCNLDETRPKLIRFEAKFLSANRLEAIKSYLAKIGYYTVRDKADCMALRIHKYDT